MREKKVDLHIHTPASNDYKGEKSDKEYIRILEKCHEDNLEVIAVTDHNTIKGYKKLLEIKNNIKLILSNASTTDAPQEYIDSLKEDYSLFKKVHIIPGVELSVYPKLHMIAIFHEQISLEKINEFLSIKCCLGKNTDYGKTDCVIEKTPVELINMLHESFLDDFFIILPHIDSSNGAWSELKGTSRSELFKNKHIKCCQILNLDTKNHVKSVMNNKEYSHKNITFIQASDFHGSDGSRPGAQHAIFESDDNINFNKLKKLINHTTPKLSSEKIDFEYKKFIENKNLIEIDLSNKIAINSDEHIKTISEKFCAFLNTDSSIFQINIFNTKEDYSKAVDEIMLLFKDKIYKNLDPSLTVPCRVYDFSFSSSKKRIIIDIKRRTKLFQYNGHIYVNSGQIINIASSSEIESIVTRNSYNIFYRRKEKLLSRRIYDVNVISKSFYSQSLRYKILSKLINIDFGTKNKNPIFPNISEELINLQDSQPNGTINGNCYIIYDNHVKGGRIKDQKSYLRFTCPQYFNKSKFEQNDDLIKTNGNSLLISSRGSVYNVPESKFVFTSNPTIEFILDGEKKNEFNYDILLGLAAFFKSNFFLWYNLMFYENDDFFNLFLGKSPLIKIPSDKSVLKTISYFAKNIVTEEIKFIKDLNKRQKAKNDCNIDKLVSKHNHICGNQFQLIEKEIFQYFELDKHDVRHIISSLDSLGYYTYKLDEETDYIFRK